MLFSFPKGVVHLLAESFIEPPVCCSAFIAESKRDALMSLRAQRVNLIANLKSEIRNMKLSLLLSTFTRPGTAIECKVFLPVVGPR